MDLQQLKTLSALKYQRSQQALTALLARENILRAELDRLRLLAWETQALPPEQAQMRAIGGDVIWLKWLGKAQRQLNIALAQALAQKEGLISQHNLAHGRKMVAEQLADQNAEMRQRSRRKSQMQSAIDSSLSR